MNRSIHWAATLAVLFGAPSSGNALSFAFDRSFDVAAFGASGAGTPRGLALAGGVLYVSDALDDQVFGVDPVLESVTGTWETDPFTCALGATCVPTQESARGVWDLAPSASGGFWVVDKETTNGATTWLIELNAAGEFLQRIDADAAGAAPGGLALDPRGAGGLLLTDRGLDAVTHFDASGSPIGLTSLSAFSAAPTGVAHFAGDLFLVSDASDDALYEVELPSGGGLGPATLIGETVFQGFDIATLVELESVEYDATNETLYLLDGSSDRVYVFTLVPEPASGLMLGIGLALLGVGRRRR